MTNSDNENEVKPYDIIRDETFKGNVFFKPITITTIDHLSYAFIKGFSQSDFASGNLQNAIIIFDEVHYYEKHTLNVLLSLFSILRKMAIPHLLMTGTAPEFLLQKLNDSYTLIKDDIGLEFQPFYLEKRAESLINSGTVASEIIAEIIQDYKSNYKIFIILNTVKRAQIFYKMLKTALLNIESKPRIILYHSRFAFKDRVKKEKEIHKLVDTGPCLVIATQVIEISLNISCDVMYSELAPADASRPKGWQAKSIRSILEE